MAIVDGELFSVEQDGGSFITVFDTENRLRIIVASGSSDDAIGSIDLDEVSVGRLRRAIDEWLARNK
ncbi:MAG TPA: hypothetical protein VEK57_01520 [Thermoanaerobaculia bacterium]|nr:hypothetical protein [Thermoanaerobaculia bacterium]